MIIRPAGVVVQNRQLLVMHYRYGDRDRFNLPGGNLESGEEAKACLAREFAEELDLEISVGDLLFCAETTAADRHVLHLIFHVFIISGTPCLNPAHTNAIQLQWLPAASVDSAPLYPAIALPLAAWMRGQGNATTYLGRLQQAWFS